MIYDTLISQTNKNAAVDVNGLAIDRLLNRRWPREIYVTAFLLFNHTHLMFTPRFLFSTSFSFGIDRAQRKRSADNHSIYLSLSCIVNAIQTYTYTYTYSTARNCHTNDHTASIIDILRVKYSSLSFIVWIGCYCCFNTFFHCFIRNMCCVQLWIRDKYIIFSRTIAIRMKVWIVENVLCTLDGHSIPIGLISNHLLFVIFYQHKFRDDLEAYYSRHNALALTKC